MAALQPAWGFQTGSVLEKDGDCTASATRPSPGGSDGKCARIAINVRRRTARAQHDTMTRDSRGPKFDENRRA